MCGACVPGSVPVLTFVWCFVLFIQKGKLMSALLSGIHDRSSVMQKAFAFALGHLVRVRAHSDPG